MKDYSKTIKIDDNMSKTIVSEGDPNSNYWNDRINEEVESESEKCIQFGEWQLCPKCSGQGIVSKPPYVPGDVFNWSGGSQTAFPCDVCHGAKILARPIIK